MEKVEGTALEKVAAATVNVVFWRSALQAAGLPAWAGAAFAAVSMAAVGDEDIHPNVRRVAALGAAPGAVVVSILREQGAIVGPAPATRPKRETTAGDDVIDAEYTTTEKR